MGALLAGAAVALLSADEGTSAFWVGAVAFLLLWSSLRQFLIERGADPFIQGLIVEAAFVAAVTLAALGALIAIAIGLFKPDDLLEAVVCLAFLVGLGIHMLYRARQVIAEASQEENS